MCICTCILFIYFHVVSVRPGTVCKICRISVHTKCQLSVPYCSGVSSNFITITNIIIITYLIILAAAYLLILFFDNV